MRALWWYAAGGGVVLVALAATGIVLLTGDGNGNSTGTSPSECGPVGSTQSAGNAEISARALGKGFTRRMVVRVEDKESGTPLQDADVKVRAEMVCPHLMPLAEKDLREAPSGTYRGEYLLIMPGHWTIYITVRSKEGSATTSALPIEVGAG
jgi:YtkA-like